MDLNRRSTNCRRAPYPVTGSSQYITKMYDLHSSESGGVSCKVSTLGHKPAHWLSLANITDVNFGDKFYDWLDAEDFARDPNEEYCDDTAYWILNVAVERKRRRFETE
jgi:hypothetical protein